MGQSTLTSQNINSTTSTMGSTSLLVLGACLLAAVAASGYGGYADGYDYGYSVDSGSPGHEQTYVSGHDNYRAPEHHTYTYPTTHTVAYPVYHHGYGHHGFAGHGHHGHGLGHGLGHGFGYGLGHALGHGLGHGHGYGHGGFGHTD